MNILPKKKLIVCILLLVFVFAGIFSGFCQAASKGSASVNVSGRIGEFCLSVSGYISPYASVVMTSDGVFLGATVADKNGVFAFECRLIRKGFSHFCLDFFW